MDLLSDVLNGVVAKGVGRGPLDDRHRLSVEKLDADVFHAVPIDVLQRNTGDVHGIGFRKQR